jgi:hypothetical protein
MEHPKLFTLHQPIRSPETIIEGRIELPKLCEFPLRVRPFPSAHSLPFLFCIFKKVYKKGKALWSVEKVREEPAQSSWTIQIRSFDDCFRTSDWLMQSVFGMNIFFSFPAKSFYLSHTNFQNFKSFKLLACAGTN